MKKEVKKSKNKMTIEDLALSVQDLTLSMQKGFKSLENKLVGKMDEKIDSLAIMTQGQFERIDQRFEKVDERFGGIENRLENLELGQKKLHQEILNINDTFAKKSDLDISNQRISRVEQKLKTKLK